LVVAGVCVVLPRLDLATAASHRTLYGCAATLAAAAALVSYAYRRMWTELVGLRAATRQSLTDNAALSEELRRERDFSATVLDTAGALVVICDRAGRIVKFNDECERLTGFREDELVGRQIWTVLLEPTDGPTMRAAMEALDGGRVRVRADAAQRTEVTWRGRGGRHRVAFTITVLLNAAGEVEHFVATGVDVTEQRRNHEQLLQLATTDPLTRLVNRTTFHGTLAVALSPAKGGRGAALLFCDLDGFKRVNDTLGHAAGDELLVAVSQRLRRQVRTGDVVARLGGDEFVVLCPGLDEISAHRLADRIRGAVAAPYALSLGTVRIGVSVGVAVAAVGDDPVSVLAEADAEMYRVKRRTKTSRWALPPSLRAPSV
jgi:cyclic di-GMP phosphodiesterase Gmr